MFAQWLLAAMQNLPSFGVGDYFRVPVSCPINDSLQVHPPASLAVKVIATFAFNVGFSLAMTFCLEAETCVECESVLQPNVVVRVPARKVFRMAIGSGLSGDKGAGLTGRADFCHGFGGHKSYDSSFNYSQDVGELHGEAAGRNLADRRAVPSFP